MFSVVIIVAADPTTTTGQTEEGRGRILLLLAGDSIGMR
jgi:hypothetical protein